MSRAGKLTLQWADGEYDFKLAIGELEELEAATRRIKNDAGEYTYVGPIELHKMIVEGTCLMRDVREVIRIGLIGGGMKPAEALRLVRRYVDEVVDFYANRNIAARIINAPLEGFELEPLGKSAEAGGKSKPAATNGSRSPLSTLVPQ
jgi:Phage tail tube protein, GTA-gp10